MNQQPPADEPGLLAAIRADRLRLVRFSYCDPSGVIRAKSVHAARMAGKLHEGIGLTRAQNAVNVLEDLVDVPGMAPVGEIRLLPDPSTYVRLPWLDGVGSLLCDQVGHDGLDWGGDPRSFLKRLRAEAAEAGLELQAAFENEFYLASPGPDGPVPYADAGVYSTAGLDRAAPVLQDIVDALVGQGLVVEQVLNEYGPGQLEISIRHAEALGAADNQVRFRDTVRGVAERHGLLASFGPKPYAGGIGSGAHVHLSVWDRRSRRNLLVDQADPFRVAGTGRAFLAGVLARLPALVALTCPSYLSYDRLRPSAWAGSTVSWGYDNREVALRIASPFRGREAESLNAELKACDGSANPYLALGGIIACGLDGVRRNLDLPDPAQADPARLGAADRERCGIRPLPATQAAALDELERDEVLIGALGELLGRCVLAVRRAEYARCTELGAEQVRRRTFTTF